jgi:hypothetical protein
MKRSSIKTRKRLIRISPLENEKHKAAAERDGQNVSEWYRNLGNQRADQILK